MPLFSTSAFEEAAINAFVYNRWLDGNAPMFTAYQDRIEILSRGNLPPKQTMKGFFAGESVPVNQVLSNVPIKLHITEHTGRGVPRITEVYGKDIIRFNENSIVVTIPFERLGQEVYEGGKVTPQVERKIPYVSMPFENKILAICVTAKNMQEIADHLGVKDRKTVRKYLNPSIEQGRIARTILDKPNSRLQKYVTIR